MKNKGEIQVKVVKMAEIGYNMHILRGLKMRYGL